MKNRDLLSKGSKLCIKVSGLGERAFVGTVVAAMILQIIECKVDPNCCKI